MSTDTLIEEMQLLASEDIEFVFKDISYIYESFGNLDLLGMIRQKTKCQDRLLKNFVSF